MKSLANIDTNWRLVLTSDEIARCVRRVAAELDALSINSGKALLLVCVLKGGVYFMCDVSRYMKMPHIIEFVDVKSYHNQTQGELVLKANWNLAKFQNHCVVVIDELADNSTTLQAVCREITCQTSINPEQINTCVCFAKKKNSATNSWRPNIVGIWVPDVWLVGYGLDDECGFSRNLTSLYAVPKSQESMATPDDAIFAIDLEAWQNMRFELIKRSYCEKN